MISLERECPIVKLALLGILFFCGVSVECEFVKIQTTTLSTTPESMLELHKKVACHSHTNCSSRILTLDTYCCPSTNFCCNWFEFAAKYKPDSEMPLKAPSILTILAILLLIICFLFVCYCFSILFCFCFKCGIFKRPRMVILSHMHSSESGLFESGNNSPKHSASSSSASSTSSYTPNNRRNHRHAPLNNKNMKKKSHNKHHGRSGRSPTARAFSNKRSQYNTDIYLDCDSNQTNDSPFLIPPELNDQVQQRINRSLNTSNENASRTSSYSNSHQTVTPSAPFATDDQLNEIVEHRTSNTILEPVIESSLSTSNLSVASNLIEENGNALVIDAATHSATTIQFQYTDEQPPSYDDIIKRNF